MSHKTGYLADKKVNKNPVIPLSQGKNDIHDRNISRNHHKVIFDLSVFRLIKPIMPFTKESIMRDIASQNLAGKPCLQANGKALMQGRLEFKVHGFHQ